MDAVQDIHGNSETLLMTAVWSQDAKEIMEKGIVKKMD
jgi:hypothetical protein